MDMWCLKNIDMLLFLFWWEVIYILRVDNKVYDNKLNWFVIN